MRKRQVKSKFWESAILMLSLLYLTVSLRLSHLLYPPLSLSVPQMFFLLTFSFVLSLISISFNFINWFEALLLHIYILYLYYDISSCLSLRLATLILLLPLLFNCWSYKESWKDWIMCSKAIYTITFLFLSIILFYFIEVYWMRKIKNTK